MDPNTAALWAYAIVLALIASVPYRVWSGKGVFARPRPGAVFVERWVSIRTGAGLFSRLSAGRNCLQVQVTERELIVSPHFPFSVAWVPELYDFDRRIPLERVREALIVGGERTQAVEVAYQTDGGESRVLQILMRQGAPFVKAVLQGRQRLA